MSLVWRPSQTIQNGCSNSEKRTNECLTQQFSYILCKHWASAASGLNSDQIDCSILNRLDWNYRLDVLFCWCRIFPCIFIYSCKGIFFYSDSTLRFPPPFSLFLLITECKLSQEELALSSNPLRHSKVLLEVLAVPQGKPPPELYKKQTPKQALTKDWRTRTIHSTRLYPAGIAMYPVWRTQEGLRRRKPEEPCWLGQSREDVFSLTPCIGALYHGMMQLPQVYWVQNASLRLAETPFHWCSGLVSQQLQLTGCCDTSAVPGTSSLSLCSCLGLCCYPQLG